MARVAAMANDMEAAADAEESSAPPRLLDRAVWRDAALIWLLQHALLFGVFYVGASFLVPGMTNTSGVRWSYLAGRLLGWDGANYAQIAQHGYTQLWTAAFYPLLPAVEHVLAPLAGGNAALAGAIVANAAALGAFGLLRWLVADLDGPDTARRTVFVLAIFPTAFFLVLPYTESLFLLFSVGAFVALRYRRWLLTGTLAALATLCRAHGLLLLLPMAVVLAGDLRSDRRLPSLPTAARVVAGFAAPLVAFAGFVVYLHARFGTWSATATAQAQGGGRGFELPVVGFLRAGRALFQFGPNLSLYQAHIFVDGAFTVAFIALTAATIHRLPLAYVLYAWGHLLLDLCTPAHNWYALTSNMRYMLVVFPLFILLGRWSARPLVERALLLVALPLLALFFVAFLRVFVA